MGDKGEVLPTFWARLWKKTQQDPLIPIGRSPYRKGELTRQGNASTECVARLRFRVTIVTIEHLFNLLNMHDIRHLALF